MVAAMVFSVAQYCVWLAARVTLSHCPPPPCAGADHVHLRGGVTADGAQGAAAGVRPQPPGGAGAKVALPGLLCLYA